ncbi:MAG: peptidoglycan-associated lipoprotein Pal [Rhodocyclaceae bacterium]|nr:peptidoglycan-associated lipoprotein Pal [Rhodocyclaceae bacterium]
MITYFSRTFLAASVCVIAACSTTGGGGESEAPKGNLTPAPDQVRTIVAPETGLSKADLFALRDPASPLSKRSIYFDFDSYVIKPEQRLVVQTHGKFLAGKRGVKVVIQGHADERGSREYNLALGQRRAEVVKQTLTLLGSASDQIEPVSFGSEKPLAAGHDETSWSKNRRADIVYLGE